MNRIFYLVTAVVTIFLASCGSEETGVIVNFPKPSDPVQITENG